MNKSSKKKSSKRVTHEIFEKKMLKNPDIKAEYDELMKDFEIVSELIHARMIAKKTQEQIADEMETTASVISRLESCGGKGRHSPTLGTLRKYAKAVGCELQVKLRPIKKGGRLASAIKSKKLMSDKLAEK